MICWQFVISNKQSDVIRNICLTRSNESVITRMSPVIILYYGRQLMIERVGVGKSISSPALPQPKTPCRYVVHTVCCWSGMKDSSEKKEYVFELSFDYTLQTHQNRLGWNSPRSRYEAADVVIQQSLQKQELEHG